MIPSFRSESPLVLQGKSEQEYANSKPWDAPVQCRRKYPREVARSIIGLFQKRLRSLAASAQTNSPKGMVPKVLIYPPNPGFSILGYLGSVSSTAMSFGMQQTVTLYRLKDEQ